jgi:hypothetical protein
LLIGEDGIFGGQFSIIDQNQQFFPIPAIFAT